MKAGKRKTIVWLVCALVVGVWPGLCERAVWGADDPNTPWDPAEHLAAHWESVYVTARLYNPLENPDRDPNTPERSLTVSGRIDVTDVNGLVGLTTTTTAVVALDSEGKPIGDTPDNDPPTFFRVYTSPRYIRRPDPSGEWISELQPHHFSVSLPTSSKDGYPFLISRLEWSHYALVAQEYKDVEVPFEVTPDWIELVPGLEILVEQAVSEGNSYAYRIRFRYDTDTISFAVGGMLGLFGGLKPPAMMLLEMQLLNAEGKPVGSSSAEAPGEDTGAGSDDLMVAEGVSSGSGSCGDCGQVTAIRYRFAVEPYELEARFVLQDIPIPSL